MSRTVAGCISKDDLAELWFGFKHQVLDKLQAAFRASKLKQEDIASRLGKDPATVSRCLRGQRDMSLRTMHDLARGMNCRLQIEVTPLDQLIPVNREHGASWQVQVPEEQSGEVTQKYANMFEENLR
jgi:transcriptional regulator with XRE-family HTH domain